MMLRGRFFFIIPCWRSPFARRQEGAPRLARHLPHDRALFVVLLVGVILIVGALTYFPVLALGPIVEQFLMNAGRLYS